MFQGEKLGIGKVFLYYLWSNITQKEALQPESWTKKTLEPNSGGENRGWFAAVGGAQIHLAGSFILEPSPQSLWFGWDPNTIGHAAVCDFCGPKTGSEGYVFFQEVVFSFFWWWVSWFFGVFYREAHCFGKAIPLPHSEVGSTTNR